MKFFSFFVGAFVVLCVSAPLPVAAKPVAPSIEQLSEFPKFSDFSVSPDGRHLAALEAFGEDRHILVWDAADLKAKPVEFGSRDMKIQWVRFVKNDVLAVSLWQPFDHFGEKGKVSLFITKLMLVGLDGRNWREPLLHEHDNNDAEELAHALSSPSIVSTLNDDPDNILVASTDFDNEGDIFRVNVHSSASQRVERSEPATFNYLADNSGRIRVRHKLGEDSGGSFVALQLRPAHGENWDTIYKSYVSTRDQFDIVGFTDDPNIAILASNIGDDKVGLYEYDISTHRQGEVLFRHKMFDAVRAAQFPYSGSAVARKGEIIGVTYNGPNGDDVLWVHPAFQSIDKQLRAALDIKSVPTRVVDPASGASQEQNYDADTTYRLLGYSTDLSKMIVELSGPSIPRRYYFLNNGELTKLADEHPEIDPASLGRTRLVYYKARDGLDIPAFLTTPNTELCGNGPWAAVVHPHGGPWARDVADESSFGWVPLMASRCLAVLRPQYRGSAGWGRKLWLAGDREWGLKMQDDKDDGAQWMIDQKIAIPGRIAMFGFSYGGYASMVAAIRPNGLYKCAIAGAGVSDIGRIWADFYDSPYYREHQGSTVKGLNPVDHADEIKIPIMVYQGLRDTTVPPEQSRWFVDKARHSAQPVEFHEIKDFAHGPAWTRSIQANQLRLIESYLMSRCAGGL